MEKRSNEKWLADLRSTGPEQETALNDLRQIVLNGLPYALSKWLPNSDPQFAPLAEEVAQDTLLRVLDRLDTFEGRSQFTTWVYKIAVRAALSELRRQKWRDVSLDELLEEKASKLKPGQKIQIPAAAPAAPGAPSVTASAPGADAAAGGPQVYTVKSGDTLTKIAKQFGTSLSAVRSENNLTTDKIVVGQKLKIPAMAPAPAPDPAAPTATPTA